MNPFAQTIAASALAGFASMGIAFLGTARLSEKWLTRMVSFAAGLMLAIALLDLLPEALAGGMASNDLFAVLLVTLMLLFALDVKLHASCGHSAQGHSHELTRPIPMIMAGGALHVFTDGLTLGAAFLTDPVMAWGIAFAILAHEVPREAGDFALLLSAGWKRSKALSWNALTRLTCVLGAAAGYLTLSSAEKWVPIVLTVAAANLIYIALTGILPWLRHEHDKFTWQGSFMVAGAALVVIGLKFLH